MRKILSIAQAKGWTAKYQQEQRDPLEDKVAMWAVYEEAGVTAVGALIPKGKGFIFADEADGFRGLAEPE